MKGGHGEIVDVQVKRSSNKTIVRKGSNKEKEMEKQSLAEIKEKVKECKIK